MSASLHHHHAASTPGDDWPAFLDAAHQMTNASCCGGGGGGSVPVAGAAARPPILLDQGIAAWREGVRAARPRVPMERGPFVLPGVTLHEAGRAPEGPVDLLIAEGRVAGINPPGTIGGAVRVVEALRRHVVTTALTDMHIHMPPDNILRLTPLFMLLNLRFGVVRARDAGDPDGSSTPAALSLVQSGALPGPQIHYAYAFVGDGRARWGNTIAMTHPDEAEGIVARLQFAGASWIKAYENLDAPRIAALCRAAEAAGMQVMGHVPTQLRLEDARLPDAQHGFGIPDPASLRRDHILNRNIDWQTVDRTRIEQVIEGCLAHGLAMTPTLVTTRGLLRMADWEQQRRAPDTRLLPGFYTDIVWHPDHGLPVYRGITPEDFDRARDAFARKLEVVGAAAKAGVDLRLGTDTQQPFIIPGIALHDEMRAFEAAGVAREQVWRMAGPDASRKLGVEDAGRIAVGQRADLIVTQRSPLSPDWSPDMIKATICGGACLLASDLDSAIRVELRRFENRFARHLVRWLARFSLEKAARDFVG
ncbi:amidohydrolase family protein [Erythrobacter sp. BLCC-B19]|uniref:amidohydrolase family protein n=1 Tax=Erythrobacter sp. BLCC-B19 TaxID=3025315 RepID=UPI0023624553|nr:amidohydrolase family protein [Erythrobacter sp. BLCC-B19]WDA39617.1 amidohydrolase family protein [Erythrobacter sp. BLCC-B19]